MLTMRQKKALTAEIQDRYSKATKKGKARILDEFTATASYNRNYAARILRLKEGKVLGYARLSGKKVRYVISRKKKVKRKKSKERYLSFRINYLSLIP
ncbi:hypothetical protein ES705_00615 [subsurface metagenome]|nr:hypothetical protein [Clostridia bacterium]